MKSVLALGLFICSVGASAQMPAMGMPTPPRTISGFQNFPSASMGLPLGIDLVFNNDATPTTIRQREHRAELIMAAFPGLRQELAGMTPRAAQKRFQKARREWLWSDDRTEADQR